MTAEDGAQLRWFCSGEADLRERAAVNVTGTVKAHEDFKGTPQTLLSRCKLSFVTEAEQHAAI
jgi:hypothetical protein